MKIFVHQNIHFSSTMIKSFFQVNKNSHLLIPELTGCIQVDSELKVNLFCKGCFFPFHNGFIQVKIVVFQGKAC